MQIEDTGIVLTIIKLQEAGRIIKCFTMRHGILTGYYSSRRKTEFISSGSRVYVKWYARTSEHLGTYKQVELADNSNAYRLFTNTYLATIFNSALAMYSCMLKESEPCLALWEELNNFIQDAGTNINVLQYGKKYILLELFLLKHCGLGLNLDAHIIKDDKSDEGKALWVTYDGNIVTRSKVCRDNVNINPQMNYGGEEAFLLPEFLVKDGHPASYKDIAQSLKMTAFFAKKHLIDRTPVARDVLYEFFRKKSTG